jgi:hypothetical protein
MTSLPLSPTGLRARPERLADQVAIEAGNGMAARPRVADRQRLGSAYVERGGPDHAPGASGPGLQGAECLPCQALPALGQWLSLLGRCLSPWREEVPYHLQGLLDQFPSTRWAYHRGGGHRAIPAAPDCPFGRKVAAPPSGKLDDQGL